MNFYNFSEEQMDLATVFKRIISFIKQEPRCSYTIAIGTDGQVHQGYTRFISGIIIHRKDSNGTGKGAWCCMKKHIEQRKIESVREKISFETSLSQEIAFYFTPEKINELQEAVSTQDEIDLQLEIHLDIGTKGKTKELIGEMTRRIESMGLTAVIKPDSYAASSYANRYTK